MQLILTSFEDVYTIPIHVQSSQLVHGTHSCHSESYRRIYSKTLKFGSDYKSMFSCTLSYLTPSGFRNILP